MDASWVDRCLLFRARMRASEAKRDGMRMLTTPHGTVRVRDVGKSASTVVFVGDSPLSIEHYDALFDLLRGELRVVCIDLPGFGLSRPSAGFDFGLLAQAAAVRSVIEALSIRECLLAFGCVNAYLAVLLAHDAPELVRGVILMQAAEWQAEVRWAEKIDFYGRGVIATPYIGQFVMSAGRRPMAKRWIAKALGNQELVDDFVRRTNEAFDAGSGWALASLTQAYFGRPVPVFQPVQQPSLLVWGQRDRSHRKTDPSSGLAYLARGRLELFDRAGHFPELEEPERFAQLVRSF